MYLYLQNKALLGEEIKEFRINPSTGKLDGGING